MKLFAKVDETKFRSKIEQYVGRQMQKGLKAGMTALTLAAESASLPFTPKVTGNLAHSETHEIRGDGWDVLGILRATASYAKHVHDGTGVYGPLGRPIRYWRRPARLAKLTPLETPHETAKRTRLSVTSIEVVSMGQKPQPFFHQGIEAVLDRAEEIFLKAFFSAVDKPQR